MDYPRPIVTDVSLFEVADAPTNYHVYLITKESEKLFTSIQKVDTSFNLQKKKNSPKKLLKKIILESTVHFEC